jgi:hypothetical protein
MKKTLAFALIIVLSALTAGCFSSDNPLSAEGAAVPDRALAGLWSIEFEQGDITYFDIKIPDARHMRLMQSKKLPFEKGKGDYQEFVIFPTLFKGQRFMNVEMLLPSRNPDDRKNLRKAYWFYKYELTSPDELMVWSPAYEALEEAVKKGALRGKAWETTWASNVDLTDESPRILDWLAARDPKRDFVPFGMMKRMGR